MHTTDRAPWAHPVSPEGVIKLTSSGVVIGNFNNTDIPGANFGIPYYIVIDGAGNAWVTNVLGGPGGRGSVTKLTSAGGLAGNFNNSNTPGANFNFVNGLAIDSTGNVWVANDSPGLVPPQPNAPPEGVIKLTSSGALAGNFNYTNTPGANFAYPWGVAIDSAGNAWVTNLEGGQFGEGSVTKLTSSGGLIGNFNNTNTPGANFVYPRGVAIDADGNAWVTNTNNIEGFYNGVTKLTSSGGVIGNFNDTNTPGSNISSPESVAIDSAGNAWLANLNNSVTELTSNGGPVGNYNNTSGANFATPHAVAVDAAGNAWVTNEGDASHGTLSEIIGAARPVRTPLVACLKQSPPHAVCLP